MTNSRWLDAEDAAKYLSVRVDTFLRAVRDKKVPQPSRHLGERTARWDRESLDAVMLGGASSTDTRIAVDALCQTIKAQGRKGRQTQAA